ncbi:hypothetical protein LNO89_07550 [Klebsiella pneumoniae subsp. pneumoniae]|nr:hypothetical protein [Klebsiella pneumoniae subsp. pneumoniae]
MIGESARRDALGAFGGHWDNTPFASSVNGYLFQQLHRRQRLNAEIARPDA